MGRDYCLKNVIQKASPNHTELLIKKKIEIIFDLLNLDTGLVFKDCVLFWPIFEYLQQVY